MVLARHHAGGRTACRIDVHVNDDRGARDSKLATFAERDDAWTRPGSFGALKLGPAVSAPGLTGWCTQVATSIALKPSASK